MLVKNQKHGLSLVFYVTTDTYSRPTGNIHIFMTMILSKRL